MSEDRPVRIVIESTPGRDRSVFLDLFIAPQTAGAVPIGDYAGVVFVVDPGVDEQTARLVMRDAAFHGVGVILDGERIDPVRIRSFDIPEKLLAAPADADPGRPRRDWEQRQRPKHRKRRR